MHKGMYSKSTGNFVRQKGLLDPRACAAATERDENCKFSRSSLEIRMIASIQTPGHTGS